MIERILAGGHQIGFHLGENVRHSERALAIEAGGTPPGRSICSARSGGARRFGGRRRGQRAVVAARRTENQLRIVDGTVDTRDWRSDSAVEMFAGNMELRGGAVVLLTTGSAGA